MTCHFLDNDMSLLASYNFRRSRSKPKVFTDEEKIIRHLFALNNIDKDFKNIVFVDECSIQTKRRGIYHNRKKSSRPLVATEKPRSVETVHVWGGISYYGTTKFTFTTTLTEDGYKILIDKYLSPFIEAYPGDCTLFQDNASTHNSAASLQALHDNNIKFIKIPAYSPDINIIELVWSELKHYVRKKYCKDIKSITERINKFFQNHFTLEKCRDYVGRVKKMAKQCIQVEIPEDEKFNPSIEVKKFLGTYFNYPIEYIVGVDLNQIRNGQQLSLNLLYNLVRKKAIARCIVLDSRIKYSSPGIYMKITNNNVDNSVRAAVPDDSNEPRETNSQRNSLIRNSLVEQIDDQNINRNSRNRRRINQPLNNIINSNGQLNSELNASTSAEQSITYSGNLNSANQTEADLNNQLIGDMISTQNVANEQTDFAANTVMEQANVETPIQSELPRQTNSDGQTVGINDESSDESLLHLSRSISQMSFDERILTLISENVNDIKTTITSYNSDALKNQKESLDSHKEYIQIQNELLKEQKETNSKLDRLCFIMGKIYNSMASIRLESFNDLNSTANMSMLFSNSGNQSNPSLLGIQNTSIELNNSEKSKSITRDEFASLIHQ
ncbi:unnamed protein product [Brachionus calyciflorus]|uniref:Tc1-like transposase DDE domain-containing protein n=1 Tax=Brachionus calyciflorus TaxID=104777 RepID=A0A814FND1_9BILA|nr:unnamed protein product [Brachionus calyciflorus]